MATKLNQINALLKGFKPQALRTITDAHRNVQKGPPLSGISRTYQPRVDGDFVYPSESVKVQINAEEATKEVADSLARLFDLQLTQDASNAVARADVKIGDAVILADVPVTYLLFLEKQLTDWRTYVDKLPTLDPADTWYPDADRGGYASRPVETVKTKKVRQTYIKWQPPTPEYKQEAQVGEVDVDTVEGTWTTVKLSGALPAERVRVLRQRVDALLDAVKLAREQANTADVVDRIGAGRAVFDYLIG
jgi:hypothetical protein